MYEQRVKGCTRISDSRSFRNAYIIKKIYLIFQGLNEIGLYFTNRAFLLARNVKFYIRTLLATLFQVVEYERIPE